MAWDAFISLACTAGCTLQTLSHQLQCPRGSQTDGPNASDREGMSFDIPVLLLTWRRPDTTKQVIEALRAVSPSHLYVASDGPRSQAEARAVEATRDLISALIDWPCELRTRFIDHNQGCQLGVSSAISWFFENEEAGIILEDDCVPHPDFFTYCRALLMRYSYDTRIWCISGDN
ncbi:MAG: hypothetical protein CBB79_06555, partial [Synechococcus sp. TMED19]